MSKRLNEVCRDPSAKRVKQLPAIFESDFFEVKERNADTIKAVCKQCGIVRTAYINSTGNLTRHYKEKHVEIHGKLLAYLSKKYTNDEKKLSIQTTIGTISISKENLRKLIINFVINENLPYNLIRKAAFRELLEGISGKKIEIPCYETFISSLKTQSEILKRNLILLLSKQDHICETIDAWSSRAQSYIGITVHFVDEITLERHSYVLAFRKVTFKQSYDNLAKFIHKVNQEFGIDPAKIRHAVTDGGSAFVKAFREFGTNCELPETENHLEEEILSDDECDESNGDDEFERPDEANCDIDNPMILDDVYTENLNFNLESNSPMNASINSDGVLDDDEEIILPKQFRCTAHNLNLVAGADFVKFSHKSAARGLRTVFSKLFVLWRLIRRSSRGKSYCQEICGCVLMIPNATRWNSRYDASRKVLELKEKIICLTTTLQKELNVPELKQLSTSEWSMLADYVSLMSPVAIGLDRLQGERNSSFGFVMPTLYAIKRKLSALSTISAVGEKMKEALDCAINRRFGPILEFNENNKDLIIASVSNPIFKLNWIANESDRLVAREIFESAVLESAATLTNNEFSSDPNGIQDDFFDCLSEIGNSSRRNSTDNSTMQIINYLNDPRRDLELLHQMPEIKRVYVKFNTTLSSSAPVERLFSQALLIFTPRRNRLSSTNFERSLIVKHNNKLSKIP